MKKLLLVLAIIFSFGLFTSCSSSSKVEKDVASQDEDLAKVWLNNAGELRNYSSTGEICLTDTETKGARLSIQIPDDVNGMIRTHVEEVSGTEFKTVYASPRYDRLESTYRANVEEAFRKNANEGLNINSMFTGIWEGCEVQTSWEASHTKSVEEAVYIAYLPALVRYYDADNKVQFLTFVLVPIKVVTTILPTNENPSYSNDFAQKTSNLIVNWTAGKSGDIVYSN